VVEMNGGIRRRRVTGALTEQTVTPGSKCGREMMATCSLTAGLIVKDQSPINFC
ncbi:hypothetical protein A2U01_0091757, partial [Trifolium medium]|nr:hypothetical protein [Trifolium medium]